MLGVESSRPLVATVGSQVRTRGVPPAWNVLSSPSFPPSPTCASSAAGSQSPVKTKHDVSIIAYTRIEINVPASANRSRFAALVDPSNVYVAWTPYAPLNDGIISLETLCRNATCPG